VNDIVDVLSTNGNTDEILKGEMCKYGAQLCEQMNPHTSVTPLLIFSSSDNCSWVVVHGWIARVLESPTLPDELAYASANVCSLHLLSKVGNDFKVVNNLTTSLTTSFHTKG
jgi:hypothetical protein